MTMVDSTFADDIVDPAIAEERRRRTIIFAARVIVATACIILWELLAPNFDPLVFSSPYAIVARTWEWAQNGTLYLNLLVTAEEILLGYVVGAVAAILLGLLLG